MIQLPVRYKLSFHPGKDLRERINAEFLQEQEAVDLTENIRLPENTASIPAG